MIKWADWSSEYNSYELASHLTDASKAVSSYERKLKQKHKKAQVSNMNEDSEPEAASHKQWK